MQNKFYAIAILIGMGLILISCGANRSDTPSITAIPSVEMPPTDLPPAPVPTAELIPTEKATVPTSTPADTGGLPEGCMDALLITDEHVGQTLCVGGIVGSIWNKSGDYHIMFKGASFDTIFFVSFDWPPVGNPGVVPGDCVYLENARITREIERYLNAPFVPKELRTCNAAGKPTSRSRTPTGLPSLEKPAAAGKLPAGCIDALAITSDDIGKVLCVGGIVDHDMGKSGDYYIFFSTSKLLTFYFVSYGWPASGASGARKGECVYLENASILQRSEQVLIATFSPHELLRCP
jgi:hypothetical protein